MKTRVRQPHSIAAKVMLLSIAVLASACYQSKGITPTTRPPIGEVTVFAASSLTDAFGKIKSTLEGSGMGKITYNFGGSQVLVTQLSQGAKADVFASADAKNMDAAIAAGVVQTGTQHVLATNRLVVAVGAEGSPVANLKDLAKPGIKLVLAAPSVPAGNYSLQVLDKLSADPEYGADFKDKVLSNVVSREDNVRQVVAKVELGEADAGIVYVTDVRGDKVDMLTIADKYNVIARYFIAPVTGGANPENGRRFIAYLLSAEGQEQLGQYGFRRADGP